MSRIVLSLLVDNTAGVLSRVAGLFSRRGYNIESLTVGVTADPRYSRMTLYRWAIIRSWSRFRSSLENWKMYTT